jgi:hypothetical protein
VTAIRPDIRIAGAKLQRSIAASLNEFTIVGVYRDAVELTIASIRSEQLAHCVMVVKDHRGFHLLLQAPSNSHRSVT